MFKKIFEYAGPYKKNMYVATVVVLVSVLMGVLPFVLAYQVISPLVMGDSVETEFVLLRVIRLSSMHLTRAAADGYRKLKSSITISENLTIQRSLSGKEMRYSISRAIPHNPKS